MCRDRSIGELASFSSTFAAGRPVGFSYLVMAALVSMSSPVFPFEAVGQAVPMRALSGDELLRIGEIHDAQNHYPEALTYYEQAFQAFRARKQRKGEATALTKIGSVFERQGRRDEAALRLREALSLFSRLPDSAPHADALFLLAKVSFWVGSSEDAAHFLSQAGEQYRRLQHVQALGSVKILLGLLQVRDAIPDNGLRNLEQAFEDARSRQDDDQTVAALLALGDANFILERWEPAKSYYEQSLALVEHRPQPHIEAGLRFRLASVHDFAGQPEHGVGSARRAVTLFQSLRDLSGEAAAWALLASLHQTLQHHQEAGEAKEQALSIYRRQQVLVHAIRQSSSSTGLVPKGSR
jgi:tetratricopeptide (TPR) repeat protein